MSKLTQTAARKELDLLVRTGLGIEPLAPALARLLRNLIGAEGCFIGWFDALGVPAGFFHDSAPASAEDLFLNNPSLFVGPNELNIFWLTRNQGPNVGNMMNPGKAFFRSNTFNLLFKACHHHHGLDLRVEFNGVIRIAFGLFRTEAQPFSEEDALRLQSLIPALQMAVVKTSDAAQPGSIYRGTGDMAEAGHLLVSADGARINMISEHAARLLRIAKLFGQGVYLVGPMAAPPVFIQQLCLQLKAGLAPTAQSQLDVVGGTLVITASWIKSTAGAAAPLAMDGQAALKHENILVTVAYRQPVAIDIVRSIGQLRLSPLQSRIALFAATGGSRIECAAHHQVSKEALKKHLREIYAASRCADWQELGRALSVR